MSARAEALVAQLRAAAEALIATVERIEPGRWQHVPRPGVWSPSKDAEHVAEGAVYHQWIVRLTLGQRVGERPPIERERLTARLAQADVVDLLRQCTTAGVDLIAPLTDAQLALATRPPRARPRALAEMIEGQLIGHYAVHLREIEAKLSSARRRPPGEAARPAARPTGA
jgi:DinB superfamily